MRSRHFRTYIAKPLCRVVLVSERDWFDLHCWLVEETGDVIYSTSPTKTGICWLEGTAKSLEEAVAEAIRWGNWRGAWRGATYQAKGPEPPEYGDVEVEYWSEQARRAFGIALAAVGGVRKLASGKWDDADPEVVCAFPDPMQEEPSNFQFQHIATIPKRLTEDE